MTNNYKINCTGLVCPLPVAKTKRKLLEMQSGDVLEISGDFAEAGENIKRYIDKTDNKVLDLRIEDQEFYIKIQKA
jgi:tRNA 2-thiouridine synthesizing protein A